MLVGRGAGGLKHPWFTAFVGIYEISNNGLGCVGYIK